MDMKIFGKETDLSYSVIFFLVLFCVSHYSAYAQTLLSENIKIYEKSANSNTSSLSDLLISKELEIKKLKSTLNERLKRIDYIKSQIELLKNNEDSGRHIKIDKTKMNSDLTIKQRVKNEIISPLNINKITDGMNREFEKKESQIDKLKNILANRKKRINQITKEIAALQYGILLGNDTINKKKILRENEISIRHKKSIIKNKIVQGQVIEAETKLPLKNVMVILNKNARGCLTDSLGKFTFRNVKPGIYQIAAKLIGYSDGNLKNVTVFNGNKNNYKILLNRKPIDFQPVTVFAYKEYLDNSNDFEIGHSQELESNYIEKIPGAFNDIFRCFATSPSVNQTNDINGLLYVRGGTSDQNLVLMDGFEVYYPYRMRIAMGGGISAFDSEIVKSIKLIPGGFSAQYGNYLSSVLQVKMNGDNYFKKYLRFNLNLLTFSSALQIPLNKNKGSFVFSTRGSVFGAIANTLLEHNYVLPSFNDFFSKISYNITPNNKIMVNVLHASEGTKGMTIVSEQMNVINKTKNDNIGLHWQYVVHPRAILTSNVSYYLDNNLLQFNDTDFGQYQADLNYNIKKISLKSNFQYSFFPSLKMDLGTNVEHSDYLLNWLLNWRSKIDIPLHIDLQSNSVIVGNYFQVKLFPTKKLRMKVGLRRDFSTLNKQPLFSPRINFSYQIKSTVNIFGAYGDYYQFPNLMSSITRGEPLDISQNISSLKAEKATHYILGSEIDIAPSFKLKFSGYYKDYNHLLVPKDLTNFVATNLGKGFSKGFELSLGNSLKYNKFLHWQINYAFAKSRYNSKINPTFLPFKWDQPHSLNALLNFDISSNCYIGFRWNYNSGLPSYFKVGQNDINFERYPEYSRLDLKFGYSFGKKIRYLLYVDMINVTNKKNIYANNWDFHDSQMTTQNKKTTIYTMPFLLSVGLKVEL